MRERFLHELEHYQQKYTWDCGLSCVAMVLPAEDRRIYLDSLNEICEEEEILSGTWTIDLCYILKRFSIHQEFYTQNLGVDLDYAAEPFYSSIIHQDADRVIQKCKNATLNGIRAEQRGVPLELLLQHLDRHGPIIILVNANILQCETCPPSFFTSCRTTLQTVFSLSPRYQGHYVVLCGFNMRTKTFLYRDPSKLNKICTAKFGLVDKARKAYGTDEDLILIFPDKSQSC